MARVFTQKDIDYVKQNYTDAQLIAFIKDHKQRMEYQKKEVAHQKEVYELDKRSWKRIRKYGDPYQENIIAKHQEWYEEEKALYEFAVKQLDDRLGGGTGVGSSSSRGIGSTKSSATGK